ncbi:hypothetical protein N7381_09755 [Pseudomonas asiatica]|uniref:hypothetical protein n=1 Tax=Pseudomonas asiatica TaxID=2219225 RepID=UPI0024468234|nr:hypothetical protein [Pseudomonas asiatica]MDH0133530.1 hypothetical protein [Pseudomonas asiatica]
MANKKPSEASATVTFVDKTYDQRPLYLASGRELVVRQGRLTVPADDAEALDYLASDNELQQLQPLQDE